MSDFVEYTDATVEVIEEPEDRDFADFGFKPIEEGE